MLFLNKSALSVVALSLFLGSSAYGVNEDYEESQAKFQTTFNWQRHNTFTFPYSGAVRLHAEF